MPTTEAQVLSKTWFYPFRLPSGQVTTTYDGGALDAIHATRLAMLRPRSAPSSAIRSRNAQRSIYRNEAVILPWVGV